jgi:cytochrome c556
MRIVIAVLLLAASVGAQTITPQPASTMSELMVTIIYPASDAIFYITTREPKTDAEWGDLQGKALAVAESANLLMMPGRARDQDRWMADAKLMLDAGRAAFRAAKAKDVAALDALNDQLYTSCTSCHQHYRSNYGRRPTAGAVAAAAATANVASAPALPASPALPAPPTAPAPSTGAASPAVAAPQAAAAKPTLEGRWKLRAAEDLRADGTVARLPWGEHPVGSIVVDRGSCYLQIMSSDTPAFTPSATPAEQMKAMLLSSYIAYSGRCTIDEAEHSVTLKVDAAWRPDYVGTEQKRFFRFENGVLLFGPAQGSIRAGTETLTRRLTLDRVQ